ncbi:DNA translocase FtsK 4TM domain-containing protein [Deltaproteobacteria bacterium]|nr:DNA translocase FtsK 4TM domain-containing protein [Deltaproteobacteria bacterium]
MGFNKLRIDYLFFGATGLFLMMSVCTADFQDPTVFNQLYPSNGISNWTGLIGAIIGGSLLEVFGPAALLLAWLFLRINLHYPRRISRLSGTYYAFVIAFLLSIVHEIILRNHFINSADLNYIWQNGYAGKLALGWIESSKYPVLYLTGVIGMFILSFLRMFHVLSPLPFISGFFSILYNLLSFIAGKISRPPATNFPPSRQLTDFKHNLHFEEYPAS